MPHLTPVKYKILIKYFESHGFEVKRQKGSHIAMSKPGCIRPLIIPAHNTEVSTGVLMSCLRTAGIDRDDFIKDINNFR